MPPSAKRSARAKRTTAVASEKADLPDSSPSRPAKRRRQTAAQPKTLPATQDQLFMSDEEIVIAVAQHLQQPDPVPQASIDHSNEYHESESSEGVQAYAKIAGNGWTYYVKRLNNNIGRNAEGAPPAKEQRTSGDAGFGLSAAATEMNRIHIDLGPSKMISRLHAEISYDSEKETWQIVVNGRNGVKIDEVMLRHGHGQSLESGNVIDIGGAEMMFILPGGDVKLRIADTYLRRAGLIAQADVTADRNSADGTIGSSSPQSLRHAHTFQSQPGQAGSHPIAPAPPDYKRPDTPVKQRPWGGHATQSPFGGGSGTMVMNTDQVDLSLDENAHIKPNFSYAQLITQAILSDPSEMLNLAGIYAYIMKYYAFYRRSESIPGWQNSIRHNLSLSKSFQKVPRTSDEPGKGMKWHIVPESRQELEKLARNAKGQHRTSSIPRSPGPFSNDLEDPNGGETTPSSALPHHRVKRSPNSKSPSLGSYPRPGNAAAAAQFTPDNRTSSHINGNNLPPSSNYPGGDGSPLPRHRRAAQHQQHQQSGGNGSNGGGGGFGLSERMPGSPPTLLSSSFLPDDINSSFVTPAPLRVHPHLAPPSTAQRPSQHMPTSSPAPFWKFADFGSTPLRGAGGAAAAPFFEMSPIKGSGIGAVAAAAASGARGAADGGRGRGRGDVLESRRGSGGGGGEGGGLPLPLQSSSPPPVARDGDNSPTRKGAGVAAASASSATAATAAAAAAAAAVATQEAVPQLPPLDDDDDDEPAVDLLGGFQSIGSYHAPARSGLPVAGAVNGH